ncbi:MRP-L47-domain-containing protein [Peniophora sp. CONT]|nr:MRP-L47-domain-containing protein [Peniophora sp. CONT]
MTSINQLDRAFTYKKPSPPPAPTGAEKAELEREGKREEAAHRRTRLPTGGVDHRVAGATRPHLGVKVKEDHGLWHFFRKGLNDAGDEVRSAVDVASTFHEKSFGRGWRAEELRRKSFKDLHTLWYVIARERNLLATQAAELHRAGGTLMPPMVRSRIDQCRKSHARIKQVLNERRLAYEGAAAILRAENPTAASPLTPSASTSTSPTAPVSTLEKITLSSLALRPDEARAVAKRVDQAEKRVEAKKARWSAAKKRAQREKKDGSKEVNVQVMDAGTVADRAGVESLLGTVESLH